MRIRSVLLVAALAACGGSSTQAPAPSAPMTAPAASARFSEFTARFLRAYLDRAPVSATGLGDHAHDDRWDDMSAAAEAADLAWVDATRAELAKFDPKDLTDAQRIDASILANRLDQMRFETTELRSAERTPMAYTGLLGEGLDALVSREFAPLDARMTSLEGRLAGIPAIVAVAKARLKRPARVHTETAIQQAKGLLALVDGEVPGMAAKLTTSHPGFEPARQKAHAALTELVAFFEGDLLARSDGSFRVGPAAFTKILRYELDDPTIDPESLARDARGAMADTRARMLETALELWPTVMKTPLPQPKTEEEKRAAIKAVLDALAEDRPDDKTILGDATRLLNEETEFVRAHDLVGLTGDRCDVIEMPEYKRGVSVAYCDASGPLEAKPQTFLAIAPPPADWPLDRRVSQYREYNHSMLADLIVHEGMPGHYLQLMHANRVKSDVRSVFQNGSFVEGWAVYAEWLMAKHGFGGPKVRMQQLKMLLRVAANAVLDHAVHAENIEEADAIAFLRNEAFQEEGEAVGKWKRARLSQGQLSTYFYGFRELRKIRERAEAMPGFTERKYNDELLAYGSPPVRVVRERVFVR
jgi:hypothetical protein